MFVCVFLCVFVCTCACMKVNGRVHVFVHACVYVCMCVCVFVSSREMKRERKCYCVCVCRSYHRAGALLASDPPPRRYLAAHLAVFCWHLTSLCNSTPTTLSCNNSRKNRRSHRWYAHQYPAAVVQIGPFSSSGVYACVCVCVTVCSCMCVCKREKEREKEREREREKGKKCVRVCV